MIHKMHMQHMQAGTVCVCMCVCVCGPVNRLTIWTRALDSFSFLLRSTSGTR